MAAYSKDRTLIEDARSMTPTQTDDNALFWGDRFPQAVMPATTGAVVIKLVGGDELTMPALPAGQWTSCPPFKSVRATGTTPTTVVVGITFR